MAGTKGGGRGSARQEQSWGALPPRSSGPCAGLADCLHKGSSPSAARPGATVPSALAPCSFIRGSLPGAGGRRAAAAGPRRVLRGWAGEGEAALQGGQPAA